MSDQTQADADAQPAHDPDADDGFFDEPERRELSTLDVGHIVEMPGESDPVQLVDRTFAGEHQDSVWAYVDPVSGVYEGLAEDGVGLTSEAVYVTVLGYRQQAHQNGV